VLRTFALAKTGCAAVIITASAYRPTHMPPQNAHVMENLVANDMSVYNLLICCFGFNDFMLSLLMLS
jgi:hypothetical protein